MSSEDFKALQGLLGAFRGTFRRASGWIERRIRNQHIPEDIGALHRLLSELQCGFKCLSGYFKPFRAYQSISKR